MYITKCVCACIPIFAYLHFRFHVQWTASFQKVIWAIELPSELHRKLLRYSPCMRRNTLETISIVYQNLREEYVLLIIFFCFCITILWMTYHHQPFWWIFSLWNDDENDHRHWRVSKSDLRHPSPKRIRTYSILNKKPVTKNMF